MDPLWLTVKQLNTSGEDGLCRRPPPPPPPHHNFPPSSPQPFHQRPNGWGGYFPLRINVHEATGVVNKLLLTSRPLIAGIVRQLVGPHPTLVHVSPRTAGLGQSILTRSIRQLRPLHPLHPTAKW